MYKQNETVIMMNNLQESILIKSQDKIDFMNSNFVSQFKQKIDSNIGTLDMGLDIEDVRPTFIDKVRSLFNSSNKKKKNEIKQM